MQLGVSDMRVWWNQRSGRGWWRRRRQWQPLPTSSALLVCLHPLSKTLDSLAFQDVLNAVLVSLTALAFESHDSDECVGHRTQRRCRGVGRGKSASA
eukprot:3476346-Rhodomonas_salina.5